MAEQSSRIVSLLSKLVRNERLTEEEKKEVDAWIAQSPYNNDLYNQIMNGAFESEIKSLLEDTDVDSAWERLSPRIQKGKVSFMRKPWVRYAATAAVFLFVVTTIYFVVNKSNKKAVPDNLTKTTAPVNNDIAPGSSYATLQLSDGSVVQLNGNASGVLKTEGDTKIIGSEGLVSYSASTAAGTTETLQYNTLSIGRKGEYELMLSDGSRVWLNSSTRLRYPVAFAANERVVYVTGEAFFKIAKDASRPFRVVVEGVGNKKSSTLEVLGTEFNVKSYADEPEDVAFTLVEGSVRVSHNNALRILKPSEQVKVNNNGDLSLYHPNIESVIAWKNKKFFFKKANVKTVFSQLSRWYDIDIQFDADASQGQFSGIIARNVNLSETLEMLRIGGINFEFDGKKLTFKSVAE